MSTKFIQEAFQRHPRPQLPTKAALLERSRKNIEENSTHRPPKAASPRPVSNDEDPWSTRTLLGELKQGNQHWLVYEKQGDLVMTKKVDPERGRRVTEKLQLLSHSNIANVKQIFIYDSLMHLEFDYTRFTLEEMLNVHLHLDEPHIRVISTSIFAAIKHMSAAGIIHTSISTSAIRICRKTGNVFLSNFEDAVWRNPELTSNIDLQSLGYVVLECMNGRPCKRLRDPLYVLQQRKLNKIFGLEDGERWSEFKLLIDFLDELLNEDKPAISKFDRPHHYISEPPNPGILGAFLEVVSFECFTFWRPAAAISALGAKSK